MPRDDLRTAIAQRAAQLIAEGLNDYMAAKEKAARQLRAKDRQVLPDNQEIERALRDHLRLFASDTQPDVLRSLRQVALHAMTWLEAFSPWLTGSILTGTATEYSDIELELLEADEKSFELFLLNQGCDFDTRALRDPGRRKSAMTYELEFEDVPLRVTVFESHAHRLSWYARGRINQDRVQIQDALARFSVDGDR
jgi:hypothetical protein